MADAKKPYRVLARKYRPQHFDDLIGQEVLVRTLKNAIEGDRIAHAFMLTGIRGVGKTTTARIIAKALNYTGADGNAGPTTGPTDDCLTCQAISEDRHPDILEMDAASRTGVNDIREILDGVRYAPSSARYKIYIIDEVHMLSSSAFNALLKTLEEPPAHVKFIFATTEIRKVPVTVLSRCQRFDLRRVDLNTLRDHYQRICELENTEIEGEALTMIARSADGSVRDGLSLLDQAITLMGGKITADLTADMLGLADRSRTLTLLENILSGRTNEALEAMEDLYRNGSDPVILIQDLLEYVHLLSKTKAVPDVPASSLNMDNESHARISELAGKLSMPVLGRAWQILLKGLGEMNFAPNPQAAAEMLIIRLGFAADLPDPSDLLRKLKGSGLSGSPKATENYYSSGKSGTGTPASSAVINSAAATAPAYSTETATDLNPDNIEEVMTILQDAGEHLLASQIFHFVHPVKISKGRLEISVEPEAPPALAQNIGKILSNLDDCRWVVLVSSERGGPTLAELEKQKEQNKLNQVRELPLVKEVMNIFPGAEIIKIHEKITED